MQQRRAFTQSAISMSIATFSVCGALVTACSSSDDDSPGPGTGSGGAHDVSTGGHAGSGGRAGGSGGAGVITGSGGASGSGGRSGTGGAIGSGGAGSSGTGGGAADAGERDADVDMTDSGTIDASGCNMAFVTSNKCNPTIEFQNDEADGDAAMFDQVIPDPEAAMKAIACQICTILYRDPDEVTRRPQMIRLHIHDFDGVANAGGGLINFSSRHIANYDEPDDARFEYLGVLIHEITHLYQFDDGGGGLVEGMADFVRIRAGHHRMNRRTQGGAWTDAYTTSGFFYSWLAGPGGLQTDGRTPADPDIGWAINQQMDGNWSEQVFEDRLGQDVDTLWDAYQDAIQ